MRALVWAWRVTTVIYLLAFTQADTLPFYKALDGPVVRWVMASSGDVYRNYEGLHHNAAIDPVLEPLTDNSPLRTTRFPYRRSPRRPAEAPDALLDE